MRHLIKNPKYFLTLLSIHFTVTTFPQVKSDFKNDSINRSIVFKKNKLFENPLFGMEVTASMLPKARIRAEQGKYKLRSHLQSSYDAGINYLCYVNKNLSISTGFHFIIGKRNFFVHIPPEDINYRNGRYYIEEKELWGSFRIPLLIEKKLSTSETSPFSIKAGLNFRYSGIMPDEGFGVTVIDPNNQVTDVFNAQISARNNGKPWITFLAGVSKLILLDNKNILSVTLQSDISTTYFLKSNYEITIPNQPITRGTYKINGTSLGLSLQYIFTGTNKQLVKSQKKRRDQDTVLANQFKRADILKNYVFKGNHFQFNFAWLYTLKARLKNTFGNYPVSTSAARGLLLSFKYQVNFNNKYSLITGPEAMLAGRNLKASFSKNDFSPPLVSDYNTKGLVQDMILSLPLITEKRWLYAHNKFFFADAGIRLNFSLGADYDGYSVYVKNTLNGFYNAGGVDVNANNDAKPWLSFPINAGHSWLAKNNNLLQLAICSNISFTKYVDGTYQINIPNQSLTEGKYSSTGSFIGLSFNYVFTNANYRIRKAYEK
jgi:hypothetical protein